MTNDERNLLKEAAVQLDAANVEIVSLREKVASYERVDKARYVMGLMVGKQLRSEDSASEEEIRKLAASGEDLDKMASFIEKMSPQVTPWSKAEVSGSGVTPEARRDAFVFSGEDAQ